MVADSSRAQGGESLLTGWGAARTRLDCLGVTQGMTVRKRLSGDGGLKQSG